jgi:hypothetical protein
MTASLDDFDYHGALLVIETDAYLEQRGLS